MATFDPETGGAMGEFGDILTNKWVWIGGLALGAVLLFARSSGSSGGGSSYDPTAYLSAMNAQAGQNYAISAQSATQLALASFQNDATKTTTVLNYLSNRDAVNGGVETARITSMAGYMNNLLSTNAAVSIDVANNAERLREVGITTAGASDVARVNAKAVSDASHASMWTTLGSALIGGLTNVAKVAAI